jgi:hypothetical protein
MLRIGLDRLVNSAAFTRRIDAALEPVLGPERLVAGAQLIAGPSPYGVVVGAALLTVPVAALMDPGRFLRHHHHDLAVFWLIMLLGAIPSLVHPVITLATRRPVFVGVSGQHLVYGRLSMFRKRLTNIVVVPYGGGRITAYRKRRRTTTVDLEVPGTGKLRLHAIKTKRRDLECVLASAQAAGVLLAATGVPSPAEAFGSA